MENKNQQKPQIIFTLKFTIEELNLILTALSEAPLKFSKNAEAMILAQALPQEEEWRKSQEKPILHSV